MDWFPVYEEKRARYERALVMQGNTAYAAGLALLMAGDADAAVWLRRAAARWRESWDVGESAEAWGRPIGALKASVLAEDGAAVDELARWTLELGAPTAASSIGRYAGALALLTARRPAEAAHVAESLRGRDDFPGDVADALAAIALGDPAGAATAVDSVVHSFETRDEFLEEMRVADTALALVALARRNDLDVPLPSSAFLPTERSGGRRS